MHLASFDSRLGTIMSSAKTLSHHRVLIVGTGSIAKRHLAVMSSLGVKRAEFVSRSARNIDIPGVQLTATSRDKAKSEKYDLVVICSATQDHLEDLRDFGRRAGQVLIEKPISGSRTELNMASAEGLFEGEVYVSFPWRFKDAFAALMLKTPILKSRDVMIFGENRSWLPAWRPDRSAQVGYWNNPGSGGIALELIHDFDLAQLLAGGFRGLRIDDVSEGILGMRVSESINVQGSGNGGEQISLHLDFCTQEPSRHLQISDGENSWLWNMLQSTVVDITEDNSAGEIFPVDVDRNESFRRQYEEIISPGMYPLPACLARDAEGLNRMILVALDEAHAN